MLKFDINKLFYSTLHSGSLQRWLAGAGIVCCRAVLTLHICDPHKEEKWAAMVLAIKKVQCQASAVYHCRTRWLLLKNAIKYIKAALPVPGKQHRLVKLKR